MPAKEDLTGQTINGLKVEGLSHVSGYRPYWVVRCKCGKLRKPMLVRSIKKFSGRCQCLPQAGDRAGGLTYICRTDKTKCPNDPVGKVRVFCKLKCDCGRVYEALHEEFRKFKKNCGRCYSKIIADGEFAKVDISTKTYPNRWALVDIEDVEEIRKFKWRCISKNKQFYAQTSFEGKNMYMHHLIQKIEEGQVIDHISGDGLDNTKGNLRAVCQGVNSRNTKIPSNNTSGFIGVSWNKRKSRWMAKINFNYKQNVLGYFDDIKDAVAARKEAEKEYGYHQNHGRA